MHLGARQYDPVLGRFLSVDPLLVDDDLRQYNGYQYAGQDPITYSDPSGEALVGGWGPSWQDRDPGHRWPRASGPGPVRAAVPGADAPQPVIGTIR